MIVIMLQTLYDSVYEACNHILINENSKENMKLA